MPLTPSDNIADAWKEAVRLLRRRGATVRHNVTPAARARLEHEILSAPERAYIWHEAPRGVGALVWHRDLPYASRRESDPPAPPLTEIHLHHDGTIDTPLASARAARLVFTMQGFHVTWDGTHTGDVTIHIPHH